MSRVRQFLSLLALAGLLAGLFPGLLAAQGVAPRQGPGTSNTVVRLYYGDRAGLETIAAQYDIWEVHHEQGYAVVMLSPDEYAGLRAQGYRMELDLFKTFLVRYPDAIPGYPCYRTVEETYEALQSLAAAYPGLTELIDYGDSWDKVTVGGPEGYDLWALRITNEDILGPKPTFFLMAEIHAREYVTAETATRLAELILADYGTDPTKTFFVDYSNIYIVPMVNPDGRKFAEQGELWRKNTDNDDGCVSYPNYGTDLNRNYNFHWGGAGTNPCGETYQGPSAASEPETQAIQELVSSLFPDQRGPGDSDPAPADATGILITLHSYSELVLWPWGWTTNQAPNAAQLQTVGRKLAWYNDYTPQQSVQLYPTTGTTDDWSYGTLGIASYTFEMGTAFFQGCTSFENSIYPVNRDALLYAWSIADTPYMTAYGPDALSVAVTPNSVPRGLPTTLTATINDTRRKTDPAQTIAAAEYFVLPLHGSTPPGDPGTGIAMSPADGSWNNTVENVVATVDTSGLTSGDYIIAVRGKDSADNWGPFAAAFLTIEGQCVPVTITNVIATPSGCTASFAAELLGDGPFDYAWDWGPFGSSSAPNPTVDFGWPGTYPYTLTVSNCGGEGVDTYADTVTVDCCVAPDGAAFDLAPADPVPGQTVAFSGTATGTDLAYSWAFGDGSAGSGANVAHAYAVGGDYTVVMTASNGCGEDSAQQTLHVCRAAEGAGFTWTPITPTVGQWVSFQATAGGDPPITYAWDFGDGGHGSGARPSHRYNAPGVYTVVVTANNCGGFTSTATHQVTVVSEGCEAVDITDVTTLVSGCTVTFTADLSGDPPYTYLWAFGDGNTSAAPAPVHTYPGTGVYSGTLQVSNCGGAGQDSYPFVVTVDCAVPPSWQVYLPLVVK